MERKEGYHNQALSKFIVRMPNGQVFDHSRRKQPYIPKIIAYSCLGCGCFRYRRSDQKTTRCMPCNAKHGSKIRAEKALRLSAIVKTCMPVKCGRCKKMFDTKALSKGSNYKKYCCPPINQPYTKIDSIKCRVCAASFIKIRKAGNNTGCCSDECRADLARIANREFRKKNGHYQNHRRRVRHTGADYVPGITAKKVAERDNMQCQLCGRKVVPHKGYKKGEYNPRAWSIGHIIAVNGPEKGAHTWENVQCECVECNSAKGTKTLGQFSMAL